MNQLTGNEVADAGVGGRGGRRHKRRVAVAVERAGRLAAEVRHADLVGKKNGMRQREGAAAQQAAMQTTSI